jgi:hypothetical protein
MRIVLGTLGIGVGLGLGLGLCCKGFVLFPFFLFEIDLFERFIFSGNN